MSAQPFEILVIDAAPQFAELYAETLEKAGFAIKFGTADSAAAEMQNIDVAFLDIHFHQTKTPERLAQWRRALPQAYFRYAAEKTALEPVFRAAGDGAFSILEKPFSSAKLLIELKNAVRHIRLQREAERLKQQSADEFQIIGNSPPMEQLLRSIEKAAPTDARVLITGENGSGKELVAEAIHRASKRAGKPFIKVNCAAIPKTLIESELFGHEKGAFTGAYERKIGLIEEADGGTLLLDEIGDLSLETQAKLLRVLQESELVRVGGTTPIRFDARVLAATNKNLRTAIQEGRFRSDLFFRLNVIPIAVPPLRERGSDIELLAKYFLKWAGQQHGVAKRFSKKALELMQNYRWPGNVRELRNAMERAAIMIDHDEISADDLKRILPDLQAIADGKDGFALLDGKSLREKMADFEKHILAEAYRHSKGNVSRMARLLKTDRANLHRKLSRYGIR